MKLNILAIGAHPDDVELGCAGTLIKHVKKGEKVGILDLTQGELGSNGTIETRYAESAAAAKVMGVVMRDNLKMRDGFFVNDETHQLKVVEQLRKYKPDIVICNAYWDRHPDHGRAGDLVEQACFLSGLKMIKTTYEGAAQEHWRPLRVLHYIQDRYIQPDLVVDVSDVWAQRMEAVEAYTTQFSQASGSSKTYISQPGFLQNIEGRGRFIGHMIGVEYGEAFTSKAMLGISDLGALHLPQLS